jgi:hypothetical protein
MAIISSNISSITKSMAKRPRCGYCRKAFKPPRRGRPPLYCSASHRQRAYQERRAYAAAVKALPVQLIGRDIEDMRTKSGIERAVVDVLRRFGVLPPSPKRPARLRIVKDEEG